MPLEASRQSRGGQHDRRRRLLTDELSHASQWPACRQWSDERPPPQRSEHYGDAPFLEQQLRLLDLIPRRLVVLVGLLLAGVGLLAGLEFAYAWMLDRVAAGGAPVAALDLASKGSLGSWFSSLMLLTASATAILVYTVRRNRVDDYQGRYRIWLWAAACWFLLATDQAASLHEGFRELMIGLTGTRLLGDGSIWWAMFYVALLGAVGSRLWMDMRPNWPAIAALSMAGAAFGLAIMIHLGWFAPESSSDEVMFRAGAVISASLLLLAAMSLHARHVLLDAEGLLPQRESRSAKQEQSDEADEPAEEAEKGAASSGDKWLKIDPPHSTPQPPLRRSALPSTTPIGAAVNSSTPNPLLSPVKRKLTKGERRALKERLLQERLERQRRSG